MPSSEAARCRSRPLATMRYPTISAMAPAADAMAIMSCGSMACTGAGAASVSSPTTTRMTATT